MEPENPLTDEDRGKFHHYMLMWQTLLNLNDWRIILLPEPASRNMAEVVKRDLSARLASYKIGKSFGPGIPVNDDSLEEVAIHETLHIALAPLIEAAKEHRTLPEDLEGLEHSFIHVLVPLLRGRR